MTHPRAAQWHSRPSSAQPMTLRILAEAKRLMATGLGLHEVARALGVLSSDLDRDLWFSVGERPDFIERPVQLQHRADF